MKKILRKLKESYDKWLRKRRCRTITKFRQILAETYPDGEKFLSCISEYKTGGILPIFFLDGHFVGEGSVSARGLVSSEAILYEIDKILKERSHTLDISRVRIDGRHDSGDFVIQLRLPEITSFN
ncbi:MAG: hypothetical protein K2G77_08690 [Muribaculaceae bacterium]|nr:hypothetical protein [Muribaculaceae bacterium]